MAAGALMKAVYRQFHRPTGILGSLAGTIMAKRGSNRRRNEWSVELLDIQPNDRVLEIGFGPGLALEQIASRLGSGKVVGIDHSDVMVRQAAQRNEAGIAAGTVELRQGGWELLADGCQTYDAVLAINVLQFEQDQKGALSVVKDVLRPGGRVAITYQPRHRGANRNDALEFAGQMAELMGELEFASVRQQVLELGDVPAICILATR